MAARRLARALGALRLPAAGAAQQPGAPGRHATPQWLGRRAALWHGDTGQGARQRMLADPPDILLTTPESLEAMLVSHQGRPRASTSPTCSASSSTRCTPSPATTAAGTCSPCWSGSSDWPGDPIQRIGLSATVGNPDELLTWLQGSGRASRPGDASSLPTSAATAGRPPGDIELDYVGSLDNAATVISALHAGEKRLVFCESRRDVEELARELRERDVTTFVSHSSLSVDERRRAEQAFAEARDCVIVSTSTLELGIDVGDLDRVIQIDAPRTVASFLQRLGRTGRRPGTTRNALFLTTTSEGLLQAAGLLLLWSRGYVEPVTAPALAAPHRRPAAAGAVPAGGPGRVDRSGGSGGGLCRSSPRTPTQIARLAGRRRVTSESDGGMLFIGPEAEQRFGRRHFMDLISVFTATPSSRCSKGRQELGLRRPGRADPEGRRASDHRARGALVGGHLHRLEAAPRASSSHPTYLRG